MSRRAKKQKIVKQILAIFDKAWKGQDRKTFDVFLNLMDWTGKQLTRQELVGVFSVISQRCDKECLIEMMVTALKFHAGWFSPQYEKKKKPWKPTIYQMPEIPGMRGPFERR